MNVLHQVQIDFRLGQLRTSEVAEAIFHLEPRSALIRHYANTAGPDFGEECLVQMCCALMFSDAPDDMVMSSAAEFAVGAIKRAQRWKAESTEWQKLRDVFKPFLTTMRQNYEDDFHQALADQLEGQNRAIKAELCALMPSLQYYFEAPCPHPVRTVGAYETTRDKT